MREPEPVDALAIMLAGLLNAEAEAGMAPVSVRRRIESGVFRIALPEDDESQAET